MVPEKAACKEKSDVQEHPFPDRDRRRPRHPGSASRRPARPRKTSWPVSNSSGPPSRPPPSSARRASSAATRITGTAFPGSGGSTRTCSSSACPRSTERSPRPRWTWRRNWAFPDCSCRRDSWPGCSGRPPPSSTARRQRRPPAGSPGPTFWSSRTRPRDSELSSPGRSRPTRIGGRGLNSHQLSAAGLDRRSGVRPGQGGPPPVCRPVRFGGSPGPAEAPDRRGQGDHGRA